MSSMTPDLLPILPVGMTRERYKAIRNLVMRYIEGIGRPATFTELSVKVGMSMDAAIIAILDQMKEDGLIVETFVRGDSTNSGVYNYSIVKRELIHIVDDS